MVWAFLIALGGQASIGPVLPAGCDTRFQKSCIAVEECLNAGDFAAATAAATVLPKSAFRIVWDDSAVPAAKRAELAAARDKSVATWRAAIPTLQVAEASQGDVQISFRASLPQETGDLIPPGARHVVADSGEPRVTSTISLNRGSPAVGVSAKDVQDEVAFAIGLYLGLAPSPGYGMIMGRTDQPNAQVWKVTGNEKTWASTNLRASQELRDACKNHVRLAPARSQIDVQGPDPKEPTALQGEMPTYAAAVSNKGNVDLNLMVATNCECLVPEAVRTVAAGGRQVVTVKLDTTLFVGTLEKDLVLFSNDPDHPVIELPIRCHVTPRYRFLAPSGSVALMDENGATLEVFLSLPPNSGIEPMAATLNGMEGDATFETWQGTLPDPGLNEGPKQRIGYKIKIVLPAQNVFGRRPVGLVVATTSDAFKTLTFPFSVQKGIVALPQTLYLGSDLSSGSLTGAVIVSRPNKPFKITSIVSAAPCVTAVALPLHDDCEYKVEVKYDGTAKPGPLSVMLDVHTDDPNQPIVKILVSGTVK